MMMMYRAPPIDRSILAHCSTGCSGTQYRPEPLPSQISTPLLSLGNLPYDVTEDSIKEFFRGLNVSVKDLGTNWLIGVVIVSESLCWGKFFLCWGKFWGYIWTEENHMIKWHLGPLLSWRVFSSSSSWQSYRANSIPYRYRRVCQEHIPFSLRNLKVTYPVECWKVGESFSKLVLFC